MSWMWISTDSNHELFINTRAFHRVPRILDAIFSDLEMRCTTYRLVSVAQNIWNRFQNIRTMINTYQTSWPDSEKRVRSDKFKNWFFRFYLFWLKDKPFFGCVTYWLTLIINWCVTYWLRNLRGFCYFGEVW